MARCISSGCAAARAAQVIEQVEALRRRAEEFAREDRFGSAVLAEARHVLGKR